MSKSYFSQSDPFVPPQSFTELKLPTHFLRVPEEIRILHVEPDSIALLSSKFEIPLPPRVTASLVLALAEKDLPDLRELLVERRSSEKWEIHSGQRCLAGGQMPINSELFVSFQRSDFIGGPVEYSFFYTQSSASKDGSFGFRIKWADCDRLHESEHARRTEIVRNLLQFLDRGNDFFAATMIPTSSAGDCLVDKRGLFQIQLVKQHPEVGAKIAEPRIGADPLVLEEALGSAAADVSERLKKIALKLTGSSFRKYPAFSSDGSIEDLVVKLEKIQQIFIEPRKSHLGFILHDNLLVTVVPETKASDVIAVVEALRTERAARLSIPVGLQTSVPRSVQMLLFSQHPSSRPLDALSAIGAAIGVTINDEFSAFARRSLHQAGILEDKWDHLINFACCARQVEVEKVQIRRSLSTEASYVTNRISFKFPGLINDEILQLSCTSSSWANLRMIPGNRPAYEVHGTKNSFTADVCFEAGLTQSINEHDAALNRRERWKIIEALLVNLGLPKMNALISKTGLDSRIQHDPFLADQDIAAVRYVSPLVLAPNFLVSVKRLKDEPQLPL